MNGKDLYFAVADIEEKWIEESEAKEKKHLKLKYIFPIAACLAIAAAVAAGYRFGGNTPIKPQDSTENINGAYAVSEKVTDRQTEKAEELNGAAYTEQKDVPKTNSDIANDGKNFTDGGNGRYIAKGDNWQKPPYKTVIFKADDGIQSGAANSVRSAKIGEVLLSIGLSETITNHVDDDVYYNVVFELNYNEIIINSAAELEKEADRLYKWCQENGYKNCIFSTSKYTDSDGATYCELRGDMVTAEFINNFPAGDYGYWIRFPNELL